MKNLFLILGLVVLSTTLFSQTKNLTGIVEGYYAYDFLGETSGWGVEAGIIGEKTGVGLQGEYYLPKDSLISNYSAIRALLFIPAGENFILKLAAGIQSTDVEGKYTDNFFTFGFAPIITFENGFCFGVQANMKVNSEGVLPSSALAVIGWKFN